MNTHRLHGVSKRRRPVYLKKLFICMISIVMIAGSSVVFGSNFASAQDNDYTAEVEHKYYKSIELEYGDTLWAIAEEYADDHYESIEEYIYELKLINDLESDNIQEGKHLTVAYYDSL